MLPKSEREFFEPRFGKDFSLVKVHTGDDAEKMNKDLNAQAFTNGQNIFFGKGKYQPQTWTGRKLIAHELAHVVQQGGVGIRTSFHLIQRDPLPCTEGWRVRACGVYLPNVQGDFDADVERANNILCQCGIEIVNCGSIALENNFGHLTVLNLSPDDQVSPELRELLNIRPAGDDVITVYYPLMVSPRPRSGDVGGISVPRSRFGGQFRESIILTIDRNDGTFAHEMGHVLLNSGDHFDGNPNNLMASGLVRNLSAPPELDEDSQCVPMRANPMVTAV